LLQQASKQNLNFDLNVNRIPGNGQTRSRYTAQKGALEQIAGNVYANSIEDYLDKDPGSATKNPYSEERSNPEIIVDIGGKPIKPRGSKLRSR
jgi:hypothetical protein